MIDNLKQSHITMYLYIIRIPIFSSQTWASLLSRVADFVLLLVIMFSHNLSKCSTALTRIVDFERFEMGRYLTSAQSDLGLVIKNRLNAAYHRNIASIAFMKRLCGIVDLWLYDKLD